LRTRSPNVSGGFRKRKRTVRGQNKKGTFIGCVEKRRNKSWWGSGKGKERSFPKSLLRGEGEKRPPGGETPCRAKQGKNLPRHIIEKRKSSCRQRETKGRERGEARLSDESQRKRKGGNLGGKGGVQSCRKLRKRKKERNGGSRESASRLRIKKRKKKKKLTCTRDKRRGKKDLWVRQKTYRQNRIRMES